MTTQRRGSRSPRRQARVSRRVWVNRFINAALTIDTVQIFNMLDNAAQFMLFDSTILRVLVENLSFSFDATATLGNRRVAFSFFTGPENLDSADVPTMLASGIGPAYMYLGMQSARLAAAAQSVTMDLTRNQQSIDIKAKRRFKENDTTLWLAIENDMITNDANLALEGCVRTLILVP